MESTGKTSGALSRLVFAVIVVLATWVGNEYPNDGPALWYQKTLAGVPFHYLLFGVAVGLVVPYVIFTPRIVVVRRLKALRLWPWSVLVWLTLMLALGLGIVRDAPELFVDWRNWVVLAATTIIATRWLAAQPWRTYALTDMALAYGAVATVHLALWAAGGGTRLYDIRIPLFYGYNLSLAGFAGFVAADAWLSGLRRFRPAYAWGLRVTALVGPALILLSFRRSLWGFLVAGMAVLAVRAMRDRRLGWGRSVKLAMAVGATALLLISAYGFENLGGRIASILPSTDNEYSNTNRDHVNDLLDALAVISREPFFGVGIGTFYQTDLIADWKEESFEVHNAFLQVWLKFGLLGLVTFIGFHVALIRAAFRCKDGSMLGLGAVGVFLIAEQVVNLVQTWPYASFQLSIHHGIVVAALLLAAPSELSMSRRQLVARARRSQAAPAASSVISK